MKVRAIAVASARSTVVGTVELECLPTGLLLVYVSACPVTDGFAPAPMLNGAKRLVRWDKLVRVETDADSVFVEFDGDNKTTERLLLINFSTGNSVDHHELYRRRLIVRILAASLAVVAAVALAITAPRLSPTFSAASAIAFGGVGALTILFIGFVTDRWLAFGGVNHQRACSGFLGELALLFPNVIRAGAAARQTPKRFAIPPLDGLLPRTTGVVIVTLSALTLTLLVMGKWVTSDSGSDSLIAQPVAEPEMPIATPEPAPAMVARAASTAASNQTELPPATELELGSPCVCRRSDSVLWREAIPRLTTLLIDSKRQKDGRHEKLQLEIAAINNGDQAISELTLRVEFYEQDPPPSLKLYRVSDRTLFYEGPLSPAKAIKWSVEARGTHFKILPPTQGSDAVIAGDIGPGGDNAAPANLLAELLEANHRPVRLHGAMMLAYLGDPRARSAATELRRALREDEGTYLQRLMRATADVRVCEFRALPTEVRGCVFNASASKKPNLALQLRALASEATHRDPVGPPPQVLDAWKWPLPAALEPQVGRQFRVPMPTRSGAEPAMLELVVDRDDLLN